jgi:hypothetical protein
MNILYLDLNAQIRIFALDQLANDDNLKKNKRNN